MTKASKQFARIIRSLPRRSRQQRAFADRAHALWLQTDAAYATDHFDRGAELELELDDLLNS